MSSSMDRCLLLIWVLALTAAGSGVQAGRPFNVTYDRRALIIDGERRLLISAGIHYPRATPQMWPDLIRKAKEGGANVIQTYVFWNGHEPVKGKYRFSGRYNLTRFIRLVDEAGLLLHLRIGPYACAEWNFGGFPYWLRDIPGIVFRTNNTDFQNAMATFVSKIVNLMKENRFFSWQGGPIILAQIENEFGDVEKPFGAGGQEYIKWAAEFAQSLEIGVPWVMCQQKDAPPNIINTCNGFYCDGFTPTGDGKPTMWTEDWNGWYSSWGERIPYRPAEDNAFAIARFFEKGGSFHNYYMYYGGTNFGHTSGGPYITTSYDYDAPIDEYGSLRQPKWGHFRDLHAALMLCEKSLFTGDDDPVYLKLGPQQEAHIYGNFRRDLDLEDALKNTSVICSAFLANLDIKNAVMVDFVNQSFEIPPWSVSILPNCKSVAYNTAQISAQTSLMRMKKQPQLPNQVHLTRKNEQGGLLENQFVWEFYKEPIGAWSTKSFTSNILLEQLNVTKDTTDYLWYIYRFEASEKDIIELNNTGAQAVLFIESMRDALSIFVNKNFSGHEAGRRWRRWINVDQPVVLEPGWNEIALLCSTVGLQHYKAFFESEGAGLKGDVSLRNLPSGNVSLTNTEWVYEIGLKGESMKIFTNEGQARVSWSASTPPLKTPVTWYKTSFDAPFIDNGLPVALELGSMGKGEVWINGRSIGRYWPALRSGSHGCEDTCDYRGIYKSEKCFTGCGQPTQQWYHVPRSWLKRSDNLLVLFEETGGDVTKISLMSRYQSGVCSHITERQPSMSSWLKHSRENSSALMSKLEISCDEGYTIHSIFFASFGNPSGQCGSFRQGYCHSPSSLSIVEEACIGHSTCTIDVTADKFGEDPCPGTLKSLAVEAICDHKLKLHYSQ